MVVGNVNTPVHNINKSVDKDSETGVPRTPKSIGVQPLPQSQTTQEFSDKQLEEITLKIMNVKEGMILEVTIGEDHKSQLFQKEDFNKTKKVFAEGDSCFFTYTPSKEKKYAFLTKGLDHKPEREVVKNTLVDKYEVEIHEVYNLEKTRSYYMVITDINSTLKTLRKMVPTIGKVAVTWEYRTILHHIREITPQIIVSARPTPQKLHNYQAYPTRGQGMQENNEPNIDTQPRLNIGKNHPQSTLYSPRGQGGRVALTPRDQRQWSRAPYKPQGSIIQEAHPQQEGERLP
ncbi:hypothetical protein JTB14_031522 [Gonioctena quinquepunctata]|nr:hypothetical protein JTB14_031522 [Gonioctena quinquepunctata]